MSQPSNRPPWLIDPARVSHERQIGQGGFATVFESILSPPLRGASTVTNTGTGAVANSGSVRVAVKHATHLHVLVESALNKFRQEVDLIYPLNHPNIVKTLGACVSHKQNMILLELLDGSLQDVISITNPANQRNNDFDFEEVNYDDDNSPAANNKSKGKASPPPLTPLPWGARIALLLQIADGVAYLHSQHVIHRDLKAANVLVDRSLTPKVCDFGLAMTKTSSSLSHARESNAVGTVAWMAPEAFAGKYSYLTDTWGFGCVAVELITYDTPFARMSFPNAKVLEEYIRRQEAPAAASARGSAAALAVSRPDVGLDDIATSDSVENCWSLSEGMSASPSDGCPAELVKLVHRCFARAPEQRPKMSEVAEELYKLYTRYNPADSGCSLTQKQADDIAAALAARRDKHARAVDPEVKRFMDAARVEAQARAAKTAAVMDSNAANGGSRPATRGAAAAAAAAAGATGASAMTDNSISRPYRPGVSTYVSTAAPHQLASSLSTLSISSRSQAVLANTEAEAKARIAAAEREAKAVRRELEARTLAAKEAEARAAAAEKREQDYLREMKQREQEQRERDREQRERERERDRQEQQRRDEAYRQQQQREQQQREQEQQMRAMQMQQMRYTSDNSYDFFGSSGGYSAQSRAPSYSSGASHGGTPSGRVHVSSGSANGREIFTGPRGGSYYMNSSGKKTYV